MKKSKTFYFLSPTSLKTTGTEKEKNWATLGSHSSNLFSFFILEESYIFKWYQYIHYVV